MPKPKTLKKIHASEHSKIFETDCFKDGVYFIDKYRLQCKILSLFDLDNTLLSYRHTLGTDQWFDFDFNAFISQGKSPAQAKDATLQYYLNLVKRIHSEDVYAVEEDTPAQVRKIQGLGVQTLILTSRGDYLLEKTNEQLSQFELNFNNSAYQGLEKKLPQSPEGLFTRGMFLTGGANKGECLLTVLPEFETLPELIIMWDDKLSNLEKVRDAIQKYNDTKAAQAKSPQDVFKPIKFIGIRYSKLDHLIKNINPEIVALQKRYFDRVLSDEDAALLLKGQTKKVRRNYVDIDFRPQANNVILSVCKPDTYKLLKDIEPHLEKHSTPSAIRSFKNKEKLASQFEFTVTEFEKLFHLLSQHGLIDPSQFDALSPIFNTSPTILTTLYQAQTSNANLKLTPPPKVIPITERHGLHQ